MKRLAVILGTAIAALAFTAVAFSARTAVPNHLPDAKVDVAMWADTVYAANSATGYTPATVGAVDNFFPQGAGITFRMWAVETETGTVVTSDDVKRPSSVYVVIPGAPNVRLKYAPVSTAANAPSIWSGTWAVPKDFPLGVVEFKILLRTKSQKLGIFTQIRVASSQLTITKAA